MTENLLTVGVACSNQGAGKAILNAIFNPIYDSLSN
jgi:hypothetical protein